MGDIRIKKKVKSELRLIYLNSPLFTSVNTLVVNYFGLKRVERGKKRKINAGPRRIAVSVRFL